MGPSGMLEVFAGSPLRSSIKANERFALHVGISEHMRMDVGKPSRGYECAVWQEHWRMWSVHAFLSRFPFRLKHP